MTNWKQAEIEKFISLIEQNPCLYNARCLEYLDRTKKAKVFNEILDEMKKSIVGLNVEKLRSKWKNLRTQYRREHRALEHSMKTGAYVYVPKLWCFQQLSFLDSHVKHSTTADNIGADDSKSSNLCEIPEIKIDIETELYDASCSSEKIPMKRKKKTNVFEEFRKDHDGFQGAMSTKLQRRKYSWLGDLVSAQMEDISPDQQADAAWEVQCLMRKLVSEGTREDTKFEIYHTR